jgi:hypothetical protein
MTETAKLNESTQFKHCVSNNFLVPYKKLLNIFCYQKIIEQVFKVLDMIKGDDIDVEAFKAYHTKHFANEWNDVLPAALEECQKEAKDLVETTQKKMSFTKEQCNMKFALIGECTNIMAFTVKCRF